MKIFISWSGPYSHAVALALRDWLPFIFTDAKSFVSSEDVRKGKRWVIEIPRQLSTCNFGIVCLTPDNLNSAWLLFEAGALSKLKSSDVCTLLVGNLRTGDIEGPLSHFQATVFNQADFFKLVQSLNATLGKNRLEEQRLKKMFEKWWVDLEKNVTEASTNAEAPKEVMRNEIDILYEVLETTREIARNIRSPKIENEEIEKLRQLLNLPVNELGVSERCRRILRHARIHTIAQLAMKTEQEMGKLRRLTSGEINDMRERLAKINLAFGMEIDDSLLLD